MGSLEKWVDELQATIDKISRKLAGALIAKITDPQDGQAIIYDAASGGWKNGDVTPPAPEPTNPLLLINYGTTVDTEMVVTPDGVSTWTTDGAKIRSGGGTFSSYVVSSGAKITPSNYDTFKATYTFLGASHTEEVTLDQETFVEGVTYDFGVYYKTAAQGNEVGMIYAPSLRPQDFTMVPITTGTGASGDVVVSAISLEKPIITTKRRKTK